MTDRDRFLRRTPPALHEPPSTGTTPPQAATFESITITERNDAKKVIHFSRHLRSNNVVGRQATRSGPTSTLPGMPVEPLRREAKPKRDTPEAGVLAIKSCRPEGVLVAGE
jgi:hypothetical protein